MHCLSVARFTILSLALATPFTLAQASAGALAMTPAQQRVADEVEQFIVEQAIPLDGEVQVFVTPPTRDFADCTTLDVSLPPGRRLASKTTVAVRCLGEESGSAFVKADVQVMGVYYVPNQTIDPNRVITADLLEPKAEDLLRLPRGTHVDLSHLVGRIAKQRLTVGRPIRMSATRSAGSIARGQPVKIEARAAGFMVTNQGEALSAADVGAPIQVKTAQGKIIQAIVQEAGVVAVSP